MRASQSKRYGPPDAIEEIGARTANSIAVAVEGCCHGKLHEIYERLTGNRHTAGAGGGGNTASGGDGGGGDPSTAATSPATTTTTTIPPVDLLLCCGDFQSLRTPADFHSLAVPPKYREMGSFYKYYSGEWTAPVLTIFVGGNHEASQPLSELYYGGWVAPNMYYLGAAGVVRFRGLRIGGLSGIYKSHDHLQSRFELTPYDHSTLRSVYHYRNVEVYRLECLAVASANRDRQRQRQRLSIMLSHDWPQGIEQHGDTAGLIRRKPFFRQEIADNTLGSPPAARLLHALKPAYWFAAHLHVKFLATVQHAGTDNGDKSPANTSKPVTASMLIPSQAIVSLPSSEPLLLASAAATDTARDIGSSIDGEHKDSAATTSRQAEVGSVTQFVAPESSLNATCGTLPDLTDLMTQFLSLDKCLPRRQYLSIVHLPDDSSTSSTNSGLEYDLEWLAVLRKTHHLSAAARKHRIQVPRDCSEHAATDADLDWIRARLPGGDATIPHDFATTVPPYVEPPPGEPRHLPPPLARMGNPQTDRLLELLQLQHLPNLTKPYAAGVAHQPIEGVEEVVGAFADDDENEIDLDDAGDVSVAENDIDLNKDTLLCPETDGSPQDVKKPRLDEEFAGDGSD